MNHCRLIAISLVVLFAGAGNGYAETPPPPVPRDAIAWKATMGSKPSTGIRMGSFHALFERTTLADVQQAAAAGLIAHQGDAGDSLYWVCFTNLHARPAERIWMVSHGGMGGADHSITQVSAQTLADGTVTPDCPALPAKLIPVSLDNGLWLSGSEAVVFKQLRAPSYRHDSWQTYYFQGKLPGDCEGGGFDVGNWLWLRIEHGRVTALHAGQVTSC